MGKNCILILWCDVSLLIIFLCELFRGFGVDLGEWFVCEWFRLFGVGWECLLLGVWWLCDICEFGCGVVG